MKKVLLLLIFCVAVLQASAACTDTIRPTFRPYLCVGNGITFSANNGGGTWASSNSLVATIDSRSGVLIPLSGGTITITYTRSSCHAYKALFISNNLAPAVILKAGSAGYVTINGNNYARGSIGATYNFRFPRVDTPGSPTDSVLLIYRLPTYNWLFGKPMVDTNFVYGDSLNKRARNMIQLQTWMNTNFEQTEPAPDSFTFATNHSVTRKVDSIALAVVFSDLLGLPTTLAGYGITDGLKAANVKGYMTTSGNDFSPDTTKLITATHLKNYVPYSDTSTEIVTRHYAILHYYPLSGNPSGFITSVPAQSFSSLTGKPTTISGYGITDPIVYTSGSYSNPGFIADLAGSKITGLAIASSNGFTGSYSAPTLTIGTNITGLLKGNGTAISAAAYSDIASLTGAPVFANLTTTGTGVAVAFTFTIAAGYTYANFQSQNVATPAVIMSSISGTTLTITCASAPILSATVSFGGFYK